MINITDETCIALAVLCGKKVDILRDETTGKVTIRTLPMKVNFNERDKKFYVHFRDNTAATIPLADFQRHAQNKLNELRKTIIT